MVAVAAALRAAPAPALAPSVLHAVPTPPTAHRQRQQHAAEETASRCTRTDAPTHAGKLSSNRDPRRCPSCGWRVLVTPSDGTGDTLSAALRAAGAEPVAYPTIAVSEPPDWGPFDRAFGGGTYDWLVFTSPSAVRLAISRRTSDGKPRPAEPPPGRRPSDRPRLRRCFAKGCGAELVPNEGEERQEALAAVLGAARRGHSRSLPAGDRRTRSPSRHAPRARVGRRRGAGVTNHSVCRTCRRCRPSTPPPSRAPRHCAPSWHVGGPSPFGNERWSSSVPRPPPQLATAASSAPRAPRAPARTHSWLRSSRRAGPARRVTDRRRCLSARQVLNRHQRRASLTSQPPRPLPRRGGSSDRASR